MTASPTTTSTGRFAARHIGLSPADVETMLAALGVATVDDLLDETVPASIRRDEPLALPAARSEPDVISALRRFAAQNRPRTSLIGMGYSPTHVPAVIQRNVLENPAWYTAYTPYQPEISQGRLEALLNFQTMVSELTGLEVANASLLDEATAAAEAMTMARRLSKSASNRFVVHADAHPQTVAVLATRAEPVGIDLVVGGLDELSEAAGGCFGALFSLPTSTGAVIDWREPIAAVHELGGIAVVATDLLACTLVTPPGELGADIAIGSSQRFGVPLGYGGPHAAFVSAHTSAARALPGRLVGVSVDAAGRPALRLALQTREQHIRREKATSNICTAQVLLANMAGLYACWHGPDGLRAIAERVARMVTDLSARLAKAGFALRHDSAFDTITVDGVDADAVVAAGHERGIDLRRVDATSVGISWSEATPDVRVDVLAAFGAGEVDLSPGDPQPSQLPSSMLRTSEFLTQSIFHRLHTEHEMLRYLRRLADRDLALDRTMIPLGSCTMKLNATTEMASITWPEFASLHPYAPDDESVGTRAMIAELESWLAEITGYDAVSVQPNAGSQGELAGLLAIRAYHRSRDDARRTVCLIPASAHGTNAASAVMAGLEVVVVATDLDGNVDLSDLSAKIESVGERLAAIMVTYPSTHGVFEEQIGDICAAVHDAGGQVYVDGANLNALVGLAKPGCFGADVSHLNLHKTFCIPHGGGGPGVGPVAARAHLAEFLPGDPLGDSDQPVGPVSATRFGSAGILNIPWAYLALMGPDGLRSATAAAILAANYVATRLDDHFPVLYTGAKGRVGHECIVDLRPITKASGVTVDDVAKRLVDFGFHAPTMSFPVPGTLMIEPTESEPLAELDRFCDAMVAIRGEIDQVIDGTWPVEASPLRHAPHTAADVISDEWTRPYSRERGAFPLASLRSDKYFPPVSRIDGAAGDRNLVCTCEPLEAVT